MNIFCFILILRKDVCEPETLKREREKGVTLAESLVITNQSQFEIHKTIMCSVL